MDLLKFRKDVFSQNGEDGVIEKIFEELGTKTKLCCEFGAWDGVHLCNVRNLIINKGWYGVLIEGDPLKYQEIEKNYARDQFFAINAFVDADKNSLGKLLSSCERITNLDIDFLSVDIDGLDYLILERLDIRPRVICIEVNAGHNPTDNTFIPKSIAENNIGQSLAYFTNTAKKMGYSLVCYSGNAFFVKSELLSTSNLVELTPEQAYRNFVSHLSKEEKEWLYLVNIGRVPPGYHFNNPFLDKTFLGFTDVEVDRFKAKHTGEEQSAFKKVVNKLYKFFESFSQ